MYKIMLPLPFQLLWLYFTFQSYNESTDTWEFLSTAENLGNRGKGLICLAVQ